VKKVLLIAVVFIIAVVIALFFARNVIAKSLLQSGVRSFTGLKLSADDVDVDFFNTRVHLKGLTVFHPEGFPKEAMAVIPEIYIDYDLGAFLAGRVHLNEVRLHVEKVTVARNREGKINIQVVKETAQKKAPQAKTSSAEKKTEQKSEKTSRPDIAIDVLAVKLGSVSYKDYSRSGFSLSGTFNINREERYENITSKEQLLDAIVGPLAKGGLGGFDIQGLKQKGAQIEKQAKESFSEMKEDFKKIGDDFEKEFKGVGDSFKAIFSPEPAK